jgi:hypothetical protein
MHPGWSDDFSYSYFRQLMKTAKNHFLTHHLSSAPDILQRDGSPRLFLRHDLKISLSKALQLAEIEHEYGVHATFMVRANSPLYSLNQRNSRIQLLELIQMGHEVGLHFELAPDIRQNLSLVEIVESQMQTACDRIEQIICRPIRAFSLYRAIPRLFDGPLAIGGRVNADARVLRKYAIAETEGCWHGGNPLTRLSQPGKNIWQLILHPIWWGYEHMSAPQRLQVFFEFATGEKAARDASLFDIDLAKAVPAVRRKEIYELVSNGGKG